MSESNGFMSRSQWLEKRPRRYRVIEVPEYGKVRIQSLTAAERGLYEASFYDSKTGLTKIDRLAKARQLLLIATVVDEDGNRLFGPEDAKQISELDIGLVEAVYAAATEHNKISEADQQELVGN